jgi:hypothetical protein
MITTINTKHFRVDEKVILWFKDRLVVPKDKELRNQTLAEAYSSKLSTIQVVLKCIKI